MSWPLDHGLHGPLVPAFKICWQKTWFTFLFHKWRMWMKIWIWSNDRRTKPFLYSPEDGTHLHESSYAVLFRVCVEISDRIVESSLGKLKLYVGCVEFLVREKYPHLKYLKWEWVGWSPQTGEMEACVTTVAWNSLFLQPVNIALLAIYWMDYFSPLVPCPLHMGSSITIAQGEGRKELSFISTRLPSSLWMSARP